LDEQTSLTAAELTSHLL